MWNVAKNQLDFSLKESFDAQSDSGVKILTWVRNKKAILCLFVNEKTVVAACESNGKWETIPEMVKEMVMGCMTGKCMFASTWLACARALYIKEVGHSLTDLEHNDFAEEELGNCRILMGQKGGLLEAAGPSSDDMADEVDALQRGHCCAHDRPHDEWKTRLSIRAKTIGVNARQLKALWHEQILAPIEITD